MRGRDRLWGQGEPEHDSQTPERHCRDKIGLGTERLASTDAIRRLFLITEDCTHTQRHPFAG